MLLGSLTFGASASSMHFQVCRALQVVHVVMAMVLGGAAVGFSFVVGFEVGDGFFRL